MSHFTRLACVACTIALGTAPFTGADEPHARQKELDASLRVLEKEIAAVRGLEFKSPVVGKVIPRSKDAAKKTQGYYSTKEKALFVYDDVSGAYERGVLIHEMVHALQDQHFGLAKLHQASFGSDAELALAALIEGDATFTMIELLKEKQPKVAAMLDAPLEKARDVQTAFLYAEGARYVQALKKRGGWAAVNVAYKFPPRSTASILHPEGVSTIDLGPGTSHGELGIIRKLAAQPETAPLAVIAAAGWKGDREVVDGEARGWVVLFDAPVQATRFQDAMMKLKHAQFPGLKTVKDERDASIWSEKDGQWHAVFTMGNRVIVLNAADRFGLKVILDRIDGPPRLDIYDAKTKQNVSFGQMIDRLLEADIVCIGEKHDGEIHHRVQLRIIKTLFASDERLGVGMEMFQRPFQKTIDAYLAGKIDETQFLKDSEYKQRWGYDWGLYRPIVEFCRKNGTPIAALNAPRELTSKVSKSGYDGLSADEKQQLGDIDFQVAEHRKHWYERLAQLHGGKATSPEQKERSYQVMTIWDEFMGASAAEFQMERKLRRMVVLAGSGHIERSFGIPNRAAKRTGGKTATVRIETSGELPKLAADPAADFVILAH